MVNRIIIHSKNIFKSLKWIVLEFNDLKKQLESQGYYSIQIYKIFLWKNTAKYFKVFDISGKCFFVKLQSGSKIQHEYEVFKYIESRNLNQFDFYPKIYHSCTSRFSYNIFKELEGKRINEKLILEFNLIKQMLDIVLFFNKIKVVHRDIRPHNIIVEGKRIKIIDFEHCSINNQKMDNESQELNKDFSPDGKKWDDSYSFKKIVDYYIDKNKVNNNKEYNDLLNMIGKNTYEYN